MMTKSFWMKLLFVVLTLCCVSRAQALHTSYMVALSNQLAGYAQLLQASTNAADRAEARALNRSLLALKSPSDSLGDDYKRYFTAVSRAGKYAFSDPVLLNAGTNVFAAFMYDAAMTAFALKARADALNNFVTTKKSATNSLAQVLAMVQQNATETNLTRGLLRGYSVFAKLTSAEKRIVYGEAHQGLAVDGLQGGTLNYTNRFANGTITFTDEQFQQTEGEDIEAGTYTYLRTGLNTGKLTMEQNSGGTTAVNLRFTRTEGGRFTFRFVDGLDRETGTGRFSFTPAPPAP